jgi:hypothetical protein
MAVDSVGWFIGTLHSMLGHDATAAFLGQPSGSKDACALCRFERGQISKAEAEAYLMGRGEA